MFEPRTPATFRLILIILVIIAVLAHIAYRFATKPAVVDYPIDEVAVEAFSNQ